MAFSQLTQTRIANAVVVIASHHQFSKNQKTAQPKVKSRMLLWCKAGAGEVRVNREQFRLRPDDFLFLPWDRAITYLADGSEPFFVGGIHIIPSHDLIHKVVYDVAHWETDALAKSAWRKDLVLTGLAGVKQGSWSRSPSLRHLAEYTVQRFRDGRQREWEARSLGQLLLAEVFEFFNGRRDTNSNLPIELQQMIQFIHDHRHEKLSLEDLARFSGRSLSAVGRLFRRYLDVTPVTFIIHSKMDHARQLLSTTRLQVSEIGRRVGIEDPYYFSKLFKKSVKITPLEYRRKSSLL